VVNKYTKESFCRVYLAKETVYTEVTKKKSAFTDCKAEDANKGGNPE